MCLVWPEVFSKLLSFKKTYTILYKPILPKSSALYGGTPGLHYIGTRL